MSKREYIKNTLTSTKYSAINVASTLAPKSFATGRGLQSVTPNITDLNTKMKTFITSSKNGIRQQMANLGKNQIARNANEALEQAKRDLSTGNFAKKSKAMSADDFDFSDFGDELDENGELSFENSEDSTSSNIKSASIISKSIQADTLITQNSIYDASAKVGGAIMASHNNNTTRTVSTMLAGFGKMDYDLILIGNKLDMMNDNLVNIVNFNNINTTKVNTAMLDYFDKSLEAMTSRSKTSLNKDKFKSDVDTLDGIFSEGFNPKAYKKMVKKNWDNSFAGSMVSLGTNLIGFGDIKDMFKGGLAKHLTVENLTGGKGLVQAGVEALMKAMIPKDIKSSTKRLDANLQLMLKHSLLKMGDKSGGFDALGLISEIFGLKQANPNRIKLDNYKKDAMGWNGIAQRALVDVIPSLLVDISAGVNKSDRSYYDYNKGQFTSGADLEKRIKSSYEKDISISMSDSINLLNQKIDSNTKAEYDKSAIISEVNKLITNRLKKDTTTDDTFATSMVNTLKQIMPMDDIRSIVLTMEDNVIAAREQMSKITREISDGYGDYSAFRQLLNKNADIVGYYDDMKIMTKSARYSSSGDDLTTNTGRAMNTARGSLSDVKSKILAPFNKGGVPSAVGKGYKKIVSDIERLTFDKVMNANTNEIDRIADNSSAELMMDTRRNEESAASVRAKGASSQPSHTYRKKQRGRRMSRPNRRRPNVSSDGEDDSDGDTDGSSAILSEGLSEISEAMSNSQSAIIQGQDTLSRSVNTQQAQNVGMFTKFFAPFASKIFGKNGLITKFMNNKYFKSIKDKTTKFLFGNYKDGKFDGESGLFKSGGNYILDSVDYLKHAFTGKEFKGRVMKGAKEDKDNSVIGYMKSGLKKAYDSILQYTLGKNYKEESDFYKRNINPLENKFNHKASDKDVEEKTENKALINGRTLSRGSSIKSINVGNEKNGNDVSVSSDESPKEAVMRITAESMSKFKSKINKVTDEIAGEDDDKKAFITKFKKQLPKVLTAGLVGGGLVLASGGTMGLIPSLFLPNSIIGGAIVGMGALFASKTESIKKFIFGEKNEAGERSGGMFSQNLQKSFVKALPIAIGAGSLGAIHAIMGGGASIPGAGLLMNVFTPGGIIGASLLSMAGALAFKSEAFQSVLFGDLGKDGTFTKGDVENKGSIIGRALNKVSSGLRGSKSAAIGGLKGAGIGLGTGVVVSNLGVLGSVLTPAGPIGAAVLGAAIGISSVSEKFQTLMFGSKKYDKDGNPIDGERYKDGIMSKLQMYLKTQVIEPVTQTLQRNLVDFGLWSVKHIKSPFELAFGPMVDSVRGMKDTFTDVVKKFFDKISEGVVSSIKGFFSPASKFFLDYILKPIGKTTNIAAKSGAKLAGMVIASPIEMLSTIMAPQRHKIEKGFRKEYRQNSFQTLQNRWALDPSRNTDKMNILQKVGEYGNRGHEFLNRYFDQNAKDDYREEYANKGYRVVPKVRRDEDGNKVVTNETKYFNSMDWFMRPVKNRRLRQWEKEEWSPYKKNDKSFQKARRNMVREQGGISDREYTDDEVSNVQKKFKKYGINSDLLRNGDDINSMLYSYDKWDNKKTRMARGEDVNSAEFVMERTKTEDKRWNSQEKFQDNVIEAFSDGTIKTTDSGSAEILQTTSNLFAAESDKATTFRDRAINFFTTVEERLGQSIQAQSAGAVDAADLINGKIPDSDFDSKINSGTISQDEAEHSSMAQISSIANGIKGVSEDTVESVIVGLEAVTEKERDQSTRDSDEKARADKEKEESKAAKAQGYSAKRNNESDTLLGTLMSKLGGSAVGKVEKESIFSKLLQGSKNLIDLAISNPAAFASIALGSLFGVSAMGRIPGLLRIVGKGLTKVFGTVSDILIKVLPSAIRATFDVAKDGVVNTVEAVMTGMGYIDKQGNQTIYNKDGSKEIIADSNVQGSLTNTFLRNPALIGGTVDKGFGFAGKVSRGIGSGFKSIADLKNIINPKVSSAIENTMDKAAKEATLEIIDSAGNSTKMIAKSSADVVRKTQRVTLGSYVKVIKNIFNKLADSGAKMVDTMIGSGSTLKFKKYMSDSVFDKLLNVSADKLPKVLSQLSEGLAKVGGKLLTLPAAGIFLLYDMTTGAFEAANLFAIDKSEVDKTMVAISSIMKGFFGFGPIAIFSLILDLVAMITGLNIKREIANFLYGISKVFQGNEEDVEGLKQAQALFANELDVYIGKTGNSLSLEAYNDVKNKGMFAKFWDSINGRKQHDFSSYESEAKFNYNPEFDSSTGGSVTKAGEVIYGYNNYNAGYGDEDVIDNSNTSIDPVHTLREDNTTPIIKGLGVLLKSFFDDVKTIRNSLTNKNQSKEKVVGYGDTSSMSQYDNRWSNYRIGTMPNGKPSTMATGGCGPTSLAMAVNAATGNKVNPVSVARYAKSNNYIVKGGSSSGLFENGARAFGVASSRVNSASLMSNLKSGKPVVLSGRGSSKNSPYSPIGHIVTATGIDRNNNVIVNDPRKKYAQKYPISSVTNGMTNGWAYRKSKSSGYGDEDENEALLGYGDATSSRQWNSSTKERFLLSRKTVGLTRSDVRPGHLSSVKQAFTTSNSNIVSTMTSMINTAPTTFRQVVNGKSTKTFVDGYTDAEANELFEYIASSTELLKKPNKLNSVYDALERRLLKIKSSGNSTNKSKASILLAKYALSSTQRKELANKRRKETFFNTPELINAAATLQLKVDDAGGTYAIKSPDADDAGRLASAKAKEASINEGLNNIYWLNNLDGAKGPKVEFPVKNDMIYYSQHYNNGEGLWSDKLIAGAKSNKTISENGNTLSALGMVLSTLLNKSVTPNYVAKNWGETYFDKGSESFDLGLYKKAASDVGLNAESLPIKRSDILKKLKSNIPVIIRGNANGINGTLFGNSSNSSNTVVAYGLSPDGTVLYHDPAKAVDAKGSITTDGLGINNNTFKGIKNAYAFSDTSGAGYTDKVDKASFEWIDEDDDITSGGGIWDIIREYFEKMAGYATEGIRSNLMGDEYKDPYSDGSSNLIGSEDVAYNNNPGTATNTSAADIASTSNKVRKSMMDENSAPLMAAFPPNVRDAINKASVKSYGPKQFNPSTMKVKYATKTKSVPKKKVYGTVNPTLGFGDVIGYGDGYEQANGTVYYNQGDPTWKNSKLKNDTIGNSGCVLSSYAMGISALTGKDYTPPITYARWPHFSSSGNILWNQFENAASSTTGIQFKNVLNGVSAGELRENLKKGNPALIYTAKSASGNIVGKGSSNHAVLAVGLADNGNKVIINDPGNRARNNTPIPLNDNMLGMNKYSKSRMVIMSNSDGSGMKGRSGGSTSAGYTNTSSPDDIEASFERIGALGKAGMYASLFGKDFDSEEVQLKYGLIERASNETGSNSSGEVGNYINPNLPYSKFVTQDLQNFKKISASTLNGWINAKAPSSSPFRGNGQIFIDASNKTGLDPRYLVSHAALESGWGTSNIAKKKNNYFGIGAFDSSPYASAYSFNKGVASGIIGGADWIDRNYTEQGYDSLYKMRFNGKKQYAKDAEWANKIANIMSSAPVGYGDDGKGSGIDDAYERVARTSSSKIRQSYKGDMPDFVKYNNSSTTTMLEGYGDMDDVQFKKNMVDKLKVTVNADGVEKKLDALITIVSDWALHSIKRPSANNITNNIAYGDKNVSINDSDSKKTPVIVNNNSSPSSVSSLIKTHKEISKGTRG